MVFIKSDTYPNRIDTIDDEDRVEMMMMMIFHLACYQFANNISTDCISCLGRFMLLEEVIHPLQWQLISFKVMTHSSLQLSLNRLSFLTIAVSNAHFHRILISTTEQL